MLTRQALRLGVAALGAGCAFVVAGCSAAAAPEDAEAAGSPTVQEMDGDVARGRSLYTANCAQCHGADLTGTGTGPPLLHEYYLPDHHPDEAFRFAMEFGVQPHHWDFGPMPSQPQVDDADATAIIAYIREAQRRAGLVDE